MERCNLLNILDPIKEFLNYGSLISNKYELLKNNYYFQSDRRSTYHNIIILTHRNTYVYRLQSYTSSVADYIICISSRMWNNRLFYFYFQIFISLSIVLNTQLVKKSTEKYQSIHFYFNS